MQFAEIGRGVSINNLLRKLRIIGAVILIPLFLIGFGSSLAASRCLDNSYESDRKVSACRIAFYTTPSRLTAEDSSEYLRIMLEMAIVLIDSGQSDQGISLMNTVVEKANLQQSSIAYSADQLDNPAAIAILQRVQRLPVDSQSFLAFADALNS